jgi:hypothetical protein
MAFFTRVLAFSHVAPPRRVEGRARAAGVLLDQVEARDRDEQLVVARVAQLQELLRLVGPDGHLLQADELADAVVHVDDQVAHLQIAKVGEEGLRRRPALAVLGTALFLEEIGLGVDLQLRGRQAEASRQHAGGDKDAGGEGVFAAVDVGAAEFVVPEQLDETLCATGRGGNEQDGVVAGPGGLDLGNPGRQPAREREGRLARYPDPGVFRLGVIDAEFFERRCRG